MPMVIALLLAFAAGAGVDRLGSLLTERKFSTLLEAWDIVHEHFVDRDHLDDTKLVQGATAGMVDALGDIGHTGYLTAEEWKNMQESLEDHFEGIGARMGMKQRRPTIVHTIPGSPARKAGLRPGDVLLQVDGKDVEGQSLDQIVRRVRGPAGTPVHLTVLREVASTEERTRAALTAWSFAVPAESAQLLSAGPAAGLAAATEVGLMARAVEPGLRYLDIIRARVENPIVVWRMLPGTKIAHLAIYGFGEDTSSKVQTALDEARAQGAKGIILDVRANPGGLKKEAVAVTSLFLKKDEVVFIEQDGKGRQEKVVVDAKEAGHAGNVPLVVLIDEGSASSAEIFAGALKDYKRATLIGTRTFGTGTVLEPFVLKDNSVVLLAVVQWLTPNGHSIWHKGIDPDVKIELPLGVEPLLPEEEEDLDAASLASTKDVQLLEALKLLQKGPK
jgi:carboxyl-terminal processing protease